jgi:hypothetical protein
VKLGRLALAAGGLVLVAWYLGRQRKVTAALLAQAQTGDAELDRDEIRGNVVAAARAKFGDAVLLVDPSILRALMAIVRNEGAYAQGASTVGDALLGGGPSIGPMQVYRTTAKGLGLWTPPRETLGDDDLERAAYRALATPDNTRMLIGWGVAVFADKMRAAGGDVPTAVRLYNGAGPSAELYRDRADRFAQATWGVGLGQEEA